MMVGRDNSRGRREMNERSQRKREGYKGNRI